MHITQQEKKGLFKVVITDFISDVLEPERLVLDELADVIALNANTENDLVGQVEDADVIMVFQYLKLSRKTIQELSRCRAIVCCGVGIDNVDWEAARERNIPVVNVPDYGTEEVADTAIGMTLALTRGISLLNSYLQVNKGPWSFQSAAPLHRLRGRVLGVVGLGRIGTATAIRAKSLGMDVAYYDPYKPDGYDKAMGLKREENLSTLLQKSFVVSLHCPLTPETIKMIGSGAIAMMPRGSYLINTARGALLEAAAVTDAILSGQLAGAGIDVLENEPPENANELIQAWRNPNHPAHSRVIINPHAGFYCAEGLRELRTKAAEACRLALLGLPLRNVVN